VHFSPEPERRSRLALYAYCAVRGTILMCVNEAGALSVDAVLVRSCCQGTAALEQ
jgi:hypothetical protein